MKLDHIEIEGFKSIRALDLSLGPMNVMIGANGAGKSNLVSAFGLLNQIVEERLQVAVTKAGGASSLLHFGPKHTPEMRLRLKFGLNGYEAKLGTAAGDTLFFEEETCRHYPDLPEPPRVFLGSGHRETRLSEPRVAGQGVIVSAPTR